MLLHSPQKTCRAGLQARASAAPGLIPDLISRTLSTAAIEPAAVPEKLRDRLCRCIEAAAWTDAALTLIEIAVPDWTLVRLACDDGEWLCSLSRRPVLPDWLDEPVEATHEALPLAILHAVVEAQRRDAAVVGARARLGADRRPKDDRPLQAVCCDNFR